MSLGAVRNSVKECGCYVVVFQLREYSYMLCVCVCVCVCQLETSTSETSELEVQLREKVWAQIRLSWMLLVVFLKIISFVYMCRTANRG